MESFIEEKWVVQLKAKNIFWIVNVPERILAFQVSKVSEVPKMFNVSRAPQGSQGLPMLLKYLRLSRLPRFTRLDYLWFAGAIGAGAIGAGAIGAVAMGAGAIGAGAGLMAKLTLNWLLKPMIFFSSTTSVLLYKAYVFMEYCLGLPARP
jgi:hypothetical protein